MGDGYLTNPLVFIIQTLFALYIAVVLLRLLLAWARADFYNPLSQVIVKLTSPVIVPLRRLIPPIGRIDTATVLLLLALQMLELTVTSVLQGGLPPFPALVVGTVAQLLELTLNVFIFAIVVQAIMSWFPVPYSPVTALLDTLTRPILGPVQRIVPPISGLDLSPLVAIVGLQVIKMLLMPPLGHLARALG